MAATTDCGHEAARPSACAIEKHEFEYSDVFVGTPAQLIEAGVIRPDQVPDRRRVLNYVGGSLHTSRGNFRRNEDWQQVRWLPDGLCKVINGLPSSECRRRVALTAARARAQQEAQVEAAERAARLERAEAARKSLAGIPRTALAFRRSLVWEARQMMRVVIAELPPLASHGYVLAPDSLEAVLMSVDAVVEQIMQSEVLFDRAAHADLIRSRQADIVAGSPELSAKVVQLLVPNATILAGEVTS